MYYDVKFVTNLDCPKAGGWNFPLKVVCIPEIGHYVESANGCKLKVMSLTHKNGPGFQPTLEIYLGKI